MPVVDAALRRRRVWAQLQRHLWQDTTYLNGGAYGSLVAFDAAGVEGCSGTPATCVPRWSAATAAVTRSPAVVDGMVVVHGRSTFEVDTEEGTYNTGRSVLSVFDVAACEAPAPYWCEQVWEATTELGRFAAPYSVAVADGVVHASWSDWAVGPSVATFALAGAPGCTPSSNCVPERVAPTPTAAVAELSIANGVLYAGRTAVDASGATGCSGAPVVCAPVWTAPVPATVPQTFFVSNGRVMGLVDTGTTQTLTTYRRSP